MVTYASHPPGWDDPGYFDDVSDGCDRPLPRRDWHGGTARTVLAPKICARCGCEFSQRPTEGPSRFSERRYCQRFCYHPNDIKGWTPQRVAWLTRLRAEGCSKSVIADRMGITRNAVVGKLDRLKLPRPAPTVTRTSTHTRSPRKAGKPKPRGRIPMPAALRVPRPTPMRTSPPLAPTSYPSLAEFNAAIPQAQRKSFVQLRATRCHWPVGDAGTSGFFFCGARVESAPYCPAHDHYAHHNEVVACPASTIVRRQPTYLLVPGKTMPGYLRGAGKRWSRSS